MNLLHPPSLVTLHSSLCDPHPPRHPVLSTLPESSQRQRCLVYGTTAASAEAKDKKKKNVCRLECDTAGSFPANFGALLTGVGRAVLYAVVGRSRCGRRWQKEVSGAGAFVSTLLFVVVVVVTLIHLNFWR